MNIKRLLKKLLKCSFTFLIFMTLFLGNTLYAQGGSTVSGVVTEVSGGPLPGVNILEKGTNNGASTDFDGNFTIKVSNANAILVISYMGFETQEIKLAGKTSVNVVLKANLEALEEIVVIGYGTTRKSDLTGSVVSLGGDDLKKQSVSNVAEALQGRMAGVQVTSTDGSPDSDVNIRVRGGGSITQDSSPLIIVDGFPVNSMSDVSPSDVENITVLKDASSTAIYGSRGANGVIIITTKSGKDGKISASFNMSYGIRKIANTIDVLEPEDFVKWQYEYALLRYGFDDNNQLDSYEQYFGLYQDYDQYLGMEGIDWQKQIYGRLGEVQNRDLSIRGGSEKINYNFNYALYDEKAIMLGTNFKRNNISLSLKSKASDKVDLSFTLRYSDTKINGGAGAEQKEGATPQDSRLRHAVGYAPIPLSGLTTTDTDEAVSSYLIYPTVSVEDNQRLRYRKNYNLLGSMSWDIIDNLQFKTNLGLDNYDDSDYKYFGRSTYYVKNYAAAEDQGLPALVFSDRKRNRFRNANTLNYNFKDILGEDHSIKLLLGEEMLVSESQEVENTIQGYPAFFTFEKTRSLTTQGNPVSVDNQYSPDDKLLSFFGRLNYDYKNRYLLTATFRADGSSKFSGNNQWGYFPSAAVAWKLSEEKFLKDVDWINTIKIRASYGESGNNNIPTGQTVQTFGSKTTTYLNNISSYWAASNYLANPDLKWETTVTQNFGLDFDLLDRRISGSLEAYKNVTQDLLIRFPVAGTGYQYQYRNMGEVQNTGIDASLNVIALSERDYGLSFGLNVGMNKNKINSLGVMDDFGTNTSWSSTEIGNDYVVYVGQSIGQMLGYKNDGRYEVSDFDYDATSGSYTLKSGVVDAAAVVGDVMPGMMKLKDISGPEGVPDGIVDINDNTIIGNANPDFSGGFTINADAYGFDLSAAFNFSVGNDVYNANKIEGTTASLRGQYRNLSTIMEDGNRWTNLDVSTGQLVTDPTQLESLNANTTMWSPYMARNVLSDWAIEDGSFLRLNTVTLGYTLPESVMSTLGVDKLRFYLTANNVFIITNYSGLDPEVSTRRQTPLTPGVDFSPFPRSRTMIFGLNLNF